MLKLPFVEFNPFVNSDNRVKRICRKYGLWMEENATEAATDRYYVDLQNEFFNVVPDKVHCVSCFHCTKSFLKPVQTPLKIKKKLNSICLSELYSAKFS